MEDLPPPTTQPVEILQRPAIDLARGGAGFPLDSKLPPASIEQLRDQLAAAYLARLEDEPSINVTAQGSTLQQLDLLEIDLTGSRVKGTFAPKPPEEHRKRITATPFMRVSTLRYLADPLKYQGYDASMTLEATNARLAILPDPAGNLSLALYDCREGTARISMELDDLERGLAAAVRMRGGFATQIRSIEIRLRSDSIRNLEAELTINASVLAVPTAFRLVGRADVDSNFNVHFTSLTAQGNDPSGAVIAAFVQAKLDKLNNKAAPLLKLPGDKIRVTDLKITLDHRLTVDLQFAGSK
jgi:hypothetical protein